MLSWINKLIYMPLYRGGWIDTTPDSQELSKQNKQQARQRRGHLPMHKHRRRHKGPQQVAASTSYTPAFSWKFYKSPEPRLSSMLAWWIYSCLVAHWISMACVKSDHFYLRTKTVTLKGFTSQPHLSLSGPAYLLRDFFSGPLCRQNTFHPNMHNHQKKKAGRSLHHYLPNECSPPHSTPLNAGANPPEWAWLSFQDFKRRQSIPITIKCKHFTFRRQTRIWTNEKRRFPCGRMKSEFSSSGCLSKKAPGRMF